ncbi:MAG: T9SS type A sorting domain-containing protein [Bacteroidia bacterium]|nr:T9SS type A sorting domain-containing protein [Bacteroidia bacterium]
MKKIYPIIQLTLTLCLAFQLTTAQTRPSSPCGDISRDDCTELKETGAIGGLVGAFPEQNLQSSSDKTTACGTPSNLVCPYNTNNGQRGCMFDIFATNSVTIHCFDANLYSGTTANYEIYYHPGTFVGTENNAGAWTLLGSTTALTSAGNNLPTAIPITFNVTIPAGQRAAFYITNDFGGGTSYTDGAAVGNFLAGDANITAFEGVGKSYPFGLTFTVRKFNGTIHYGGAALDGEQMVLKARPNGQEMLLSWFIPENLEAAYLELQRSTDGINFESVRSYHHPQHQGYYNDNPDLQGKSAFYRLMATDENGKTHYSNIEEASPEQNSMQLATYPNPFQSSLHTQLMTREAGQAQIRLTDLQGKVLHAETRPMEAGLNEFEVNTSNLSPGIYLLQTICNGVSKKEKVIKGF